MWRFFSQLAPKRRDRRGRGGRFQPRLEALEERWCPSGSGAMEWSDPFGTIAPAVVVQPDGKTVVAVEVYSTKAGGSTSLSVQRLNQDGSVDKTFNKSGTLTIQSGNAVFAYAMALQPDGKILIGGDVGLNNGNGESMIARVNSNGTLDTTFGNSRGLELLTNVGQVHGLAVLTDPVHPGTITGIVAAAYGFTNGAGWCFEAYKLTPSGLPDKTFGAGGFAALTNLNVGQCNSVAVAPSGEIYLAGFTSFNNTTAENGCLVALTPAGALDQTFGGGSGYVLVDPTGIHESEFFQLVIQTQVVNGQPVSRLIAAGYNTAAAVTGNEDGVVVAYTLSGALDTTFGSGGSFAFVNPAGTDSYSEFRSLALEADGSIVVGGQLQYPDANGNYRADMLIGHFTADGTVDAAFGPNGTGFTTIQYGNGSGIWGVATDPTNGDILICGWTYSGTRQDFVARLTHP